jgi:hypothetical protein
MSTEELPAIGSTVRVQTPGTKRPVEFIVIDHHGPISGSFSAARPSRQHPGNYYGGIRVILQEWIVT